MKENLFIVVNHEGPLDDNYVRFRLSGLKFWYSDEIPDKIIRGDDPGDTRYKVRSSWFWALASDLDNAMTDKVITREDTRAKVKEFLYWYKNDFGTRGDVRNTREDVEKGNQIIDIVLCSMPVKPLELGKLE